jgi:hypothetical protein
MPTVPVMWSVWGICFFALIAFRVYVYKTSREEEDQVVLHDSSARLIEEQKAIAARLESAKPVGLAILGLFGVATLFVFGYYVLDMIHQLQ